MTCGFVTIELRPLTYGKLTNHSVTYVSGTCVTLDSGLNIGEEGLVSGEVLHHGALERGQSSNPGDPHRMLLPIL